MRARGLVLFLAMGVTVLSMTSCNVPTATPAVLFFSPLPPTPSPRLLASPTAGVSVPAIKHLAVGQAFDVTYIHMATAADGWAVGGLNQVGDHVFRTQDGGRTWHDITPPEPASQSADQHKSAVGYFQSGLQTGWVVYSSQIGDSSFPQQVYIWRTGDGGLTWQYSIVDTSTFTEFFIPSDIEFVDDQNGWMLVHVGVGMMHDYVTILKTTDGGLTWEIVLTPYNDGGIQSCAKNSMDFSDTKTGWLTVECHGVDPSPHLFRTSDGGANWTRIDLPAPSQKADLYNDYACGMYYPNLLSGQTAVFAMKCLDIATFSSDKDYIYWTSDGGVTWQTYPLPADFSILNQNGGMFFFNAKTGLALSRNIYRTEDGGKTWSSAKLVNWDGQFSFVDQNLGWAVARNQDEIAFVKTLNGGGKWELIKPTVGP